jgi:hypothetical protein
MFGKMANFEESAWSKSTFEISISSVSAALQLTFRHICGITWAYWK